MKREGSIYTDMSVEELIERHPRAVSFLMDQGIVCMKCGEPMWGTLGGLIASKGMDPPDMIEKLEKYLEGKE